MSVALVTGASSGLGLELAKLLAADRHDLVLVARSQDRLEALAAELRGSHGVKVLVVAEDLADSGAPKRIQARVEEEGLAIELLINNAGFGSTGPFAELELSRELDMIQVNVTALVHLTGLFLPSMISRGAGRILNIASTAGFQAGPGMATYYATKAFVISFSEAIAHEVKGTGVTVTAHCPGATATGFAALAGNDKSKLFQKSGVASASEVAAHAYRAMLAGKTLSVHGAANWFGTFGARFAPRSTTIKFAAWFNSPG